MINAILTKSEQRAFNALLQKSGKITSRDEIAQSVWGARWLEKYSDWQIDRLIYLLRKKVASDYQIKTLRNSGYILSAKGVAIPKITQESVLGTIPTQSYLEYMNNTQNKRRTLKDLFKVFKPKKANCLLVINSFSADNVDAAAKALIAKTVFLSNFDKRALEIHRERIEKLNLGNFYTIFDDIRDSLFKDSFFDLIINDFRLNFNTSNKQNISAAKNMYRILKSSGKCIVSVVIDPRKITNRNLPLIFKAEENLPRYCFTSDYYQALFKKSGFTQIKEFDTKNGKMWNPPYRRFLLSK